MASIGAPMAAVPLPVVAAQPIPPQLPATVPPTVSAPAKTPSRPRGASLCFSPTTPGRPAAMAKLHPVVAAAAATPGDVVTTPSPAATATPHTSVPCGDGTQVTLVPGATQASHSAVQPLPMAPRRATKPTRRSRARPRSRPAGAGLWNTGKWSKDEDEALRAGVAVVGPRQWKRISVEFLHNRRSDVQCLHRWQKVLRPGLVKGSWEKEEDETIVACIQRGIVKWSEIAAHIPGRLGKQCRERWFNHLDPTIKKGNWTPDEDAILEQAQATLGNRWCKIADLLPGRTENAVKNRWHSAKRRQAHAARLASRAAAADAARRSGTPAPPSPKLQLALETLGRRKTKAHVPTPEAAREAARRCGLTIDASGTTPMPGLMQRAAADAASAGATPPVGTATTQGCGASTKGGKSGKGASTSRRRRRTPSPAQSPTRSAPPTRGHFIVPPAHALALPGIGGPEVVSPADAGRRPDFGLLQLIAAVDTQLATDRQRLSTTCRDPFSPGSRARAVAAAMCEAHVAEPAVHSPLSHMSEESFAAEALQAMHNTGRAMPSPCFSDGGDHDVPAAVGRCTPSPPMKLAVGQTLAAPNNRFSYTLLPPPKVTNGTGVSTFILQVKPQHAVQPATGGVKRSRVVQTPNTRPTKRARGRA